MDQLHLLSHYIVDVYKNYYLFSMLQKKATILLVLNHLYQLSDLSSVKFMFQYILIFVVHTKGAISWHFKLFKLLHIFTYIWT